MTNNKYLINVQTFEDLKEEHKMILATKGAIEEIKKNPCLENPYGAFIYATINKLKKNTIYLKMKYLNIDLIL